jgi:hypothetical protein
MASPTFQQVRWDGLRLELADYSYPLLAVKLHATIEDRLMRVRLAGSRETRDQIATGILTGQLCTASTSAHRTCRRP